MPARRKPAGTSIQRIVAPRTSQRVCAQIQVQHSRGASTCRVHRKTARETKRIQHLSACRNASDQFPILTLIQEETGLLPAHHICLKLQAALHKLHRLSWHIPGKTLTIQQLELLLCHRLNIAAQAQHDTARRQPSAKERRKHFNLREPCRRIKLHHQHFTVAVKHQPRPAIILAINNAVAGSLRIT